MFYPSNPEDVTHTKLTDLFPVQNVQQLHHYLIKRRRLHNSRNHTRVA